jgi:PncC family amidohydrolase
MSVRPPEKKIAAALKKKRKTLALAESCTGGLISSRITDAAGSSVYFRGGVIAYSNDIKISLLRVPGDIIKKHGAVSRQTAEEMAKGVKALMDSDFSAAVTGIAGPSGGSLKKPVGLAYIAVVTEGECYSEKVLYKGGRRRNKEKFAEAVFRLLADRI